MCAPLWGFATMKWFSEILCYEKPRNWFIWHSPRESRLNCGPKNIWLSNTVVFRGPIFCRQCFQIPLDLILSYRFIIMFINKKSLFFTTYLIFQTRTMRIQWAIFGPKVSVWHHWQQNVFYAKKRLLGQGKSRLVSILKKLFLLYFTI